MEVLLAVSGCLVLTLGRINSLATLQITLVRLYIAIDTFLNISSEFIGNLKKKFPITETSVSGCKINGCTLVKRYVHELINFIQEEIEASNIKLEDRKNEKNNKIKYQSRIS